MEQPVGTIKSPWPHLSNYSTTQQSSTTLSQLPTASSLPHLGNSPFWKGEKSQTVSLSSDKSRPANIYHPVGVQGISKPESKQVGPTVHCPLGNIVGHSFGSPIGASVVLFIWHFPWVLYRRSHHHFTWYLPKQMVHPAPFWFDCILKLVWKREFDPLVLWV